MRSYGARHDCSFCGGLSQFDEETRAYSGAGRMLSEGQLGVTSCRTQHSWDRSAYPRLADASTASLPPPAVLR
jgi:hypothetical protein